MLMPQADRKKIYEKLFEDGVCVVKKRLTVHELHPELDSVPLLHVVKAMKVSGG